MSDLNNFDPNGQQNPEFQQSVYGGEMNNSYTQSTGDYSQQSFGYTSTPVQEEKKGMSIASLVLGIIGFVAWCIPLFGFPITIVGIILGVIGMKKGGKKLAIAGIICSVITLIFTLINSIAGAAMAISMF